LVTIDNKATKTVVAVATMINRGVSAVILTQAIAGARRRATRNGVTKTLAIRHVNSQEKICTCGLLDISWQGRYERLLALANQH